MERKVRNELSEVVGANKIYIGPCVAQEWLLEIPCSWDKT